MMKPREKEMRKANKMARLALESFASLACQVRTAKPMNAAPKSRVIFKPPSVRSSPQSSVKGPGIRIKARPKSNETTALMVNKVLSIIRFLQLIVDY
jgi:hypothetical protein